MFERLISLVGEDNVEKIKNTKVLLIGVGGVGSYALEALVRNGFDNITIVDFDKVDFSNLNRQLITNSTNIGELKVFEASKRAKLINPSISINPVNLYLTRDNLRSLLDEKFDYVIDACDTVEIKFLLMQYEREYGYKLISSMGTAKKVDPTLLEITTLDKTFNDPLARLLRKRVKDAHIYHKIHVISSKELPKDIDVLGSCNLVPSVAGLLCVSYIFNDIVK